MMSLVLPMAHVYFGLAVLAQIALETRAARESAQVLGQVLLDIAAVTLFMYAVYAYPNTLSMAFSTDFDSPEGTLRASTMASTVLTVSLALSATLRALLAATVALSAAMAASLGLKSAFARGKATLKLLAAMRGLVAKALASQAAVLA